MAGNEATRRHIVIEGVVLLAFGAAAAVEGLRLIIYKDPYVVYDPLGAGFYILALSIGVLLAGAVHVVSTYRAAKPALPRQPTAHGQKRHVPASVGIMALYVVLINLAGYLIATLVFCLLQFRISGVRQWRTNALLTIVFTALYYVVFVTLCDMIFPRGLLWGLG